jgi:hypothetical protein
VYQTRLQNVGFGITTSADRTLSVAICRAANATLIATACFCSVRLTNACVVPTLDDSIAVVG